MAPTKQHVRRLGHRCIFATGSRIERPRDPPSTPLPALILAALGRALPPAVALASMLAGPAAAFQEEAPRFVHESWGVDDGLPVMSVTALAQGAGGYIWIGTFDGLVRFDGVRFRVFDIANTPELPSNRIVGLAVDSSDALWIMTEQGEVLSYSRGGWRAHGARGVTASQSTLALRAGPDGNMWVQTADGLWTARAGELVPVLPDSVASAGILGHAIDDDGTVWVATRRRGLIRVDAEGAHRVAMAVGMPSPAVEHVVRGPGDTLWVAGEHGVATLDGDTVRPLTIGGQPFTAHALSVSPMDDGGLWIRTPGRLFHVSDRGVVRPVDGIQGEPFTPRFMVTGPREHLWFNGPGGLYRDGVPVWPSPGQINRIIHDHEGSLWVATRGLHRLTPATVDVVGHPPDEPEGLYALLADGDGSVWTGFSSLVRFGAGEPPGTPMDVFSGTPLIWALHRDKAGELWVGMWGGGVCRIEAGRCVAPRSSRDTELAGSTVRAIQDRDAGGLWLGTERGLWVLHEDGGAGPVESSPTGDAPIRVMIRSPDGVLWVGTRGGGVFPVRNGLPGRAVTTDDGLSSNLVRSLYHDGSALWVGTEGLGLNRIPMAADGTPLRNDIAAVGPANGLYDDLIHAILEDAFGRLWMSGNQGIFWVDKAALEAFFRGEIDRIVSTSYTERDGLLSREANGGAQYPGVRTDDGRLWFPTMAGVAVVDPSRIRRNLEAPPVVIESVEAGDTEIPATDAVELSADQRDFEVSYTALSFMAPENVRFRYTLEGFNEAWVDAGSRRMAFFTNVPPGRYVFRVTASNNAGVWNSVGASVPLTVAPHLYETPWFLGIMLLALGGAVVVGLGWRERHARARERELNALVSTRTRELEREKESADEARRYAERQRIVAERHSEIAEDALRTVAAQAERLEELDRAKSRFFANISHEFRTPLTLTIGPLEDLRGGRHGPLASPAVESVELALKNSRRLLRLVNQILDVAKLEAGQVRLRPEKGDLSELLRGLCQAFQPLAERKGIDFGFQEPRRSVIMDFDGDLLEKVFLNLLSNAFKFTPDGGSIRLILEADEEAQGSVVVRVRDSGPGIPEDAVAHVFDRFYRVDESAGELEPGTGIGLSLARELVELHGGHIRVDSEPGFGAEFVVTLPRRAGSRGGREALGHDEPAAPGPRAEPPGSEGPARPPAGEVDPDDGGSAAGSGSDESYVAAGEPGPTPDEDPDRASVLVIDDNADVRSYLRSLLEPEYRVVQASDGGQGLEVARREPPDLVLCDRMMPGMTGIEVCRRLKSDPELDFVPVILVTARATQEDKVEGLEEGADDYLTKPFDPEELRARVENLLRTRRRLKDRIHSGALLTAADVEVESAADRFLARMAVVVEERMSDEDFDVETLALALGHSRSSLYRKLAGIHHESPAEVIKRMRLERAAQLLAARAGSVSEVAYGVGFKSVSHFSRCFREHFGTPPSRYEGETPPDLTGNAPRDTDPGEPPGDEA